MQNAAVRDTPAQYMSCRRIRVFLSSIYHNEEKASALGRHMALAKGVLYAAANQLTGRVLVVFDESRTDADALGRLLYHFDMAACQNQLPKIIALDDYRKRKSLPAPEQHRNDPPADGAGGGTPFHAMPKWDLTRALNTDISGGLTEKQAQELIRNCGLNILSEKKRTSLAARIIGNLFDFSNRLLLGVGAVSLLVGQIPDALAIFAIVVIQTVMSTIQSHKAESSIASLKKMLVSKARVIRSGRERVIASKLLVPGDVIVVESGDKIPADARIVESSELKTAEASLTGESAAVEKDARPCRANAALSGRHNMLFMGSDVLCGRAKAVVTATGMHTEIGRIAAMLQDIRESVPPIQKKVSRLTRSITLAAGCASLLFAGIGLLAGRPLGQVLVLSICFAIGAIPESMPAVVSASMALSVRRMAKRNVIVRSLPAVETLGSTDVICCDKTGTLTMNEMTVRRIYADGVFYSVTGTGYDPAGEIVPEGEGVPKGAALDQLLRAGVLCSNAHLTKSEGKWITQGDPTEGALLAAAAKYGLDPEAVGSSCSRVGEIPFDSKRQCMITHTLSGGGETAYCKGAYGKVSEKCSHIFIGGEERPFLPEERDRLQKICDDLGNQALRVLAFSCKRLSADRCLDSGFIFLGLMAMSDPVRPAARASIARFRKVGVRIVMITGDNRSTAAEVARQVGLLTDGLVLTGADLDGMSDVELAAVVDSAQVFARTCPEQKHRIVLALKRAGHTVAMIGDGVNDAPAMKEADIGIAMGISGSDVARDVAGITLVDDDLSAIVDAIQEGRAVTENIGAALRYLLAGSIGEVAAIGLCALGFGVLPLLSIQILWVNVITETIVGSALAAGTPRTGLMDRPPYDANAPLISGAMKKQILVGCAVTALTTAGVFGGAMLLGGGLAMARTLAFSALIASQLTRANRSGRGQVRALPVRAATLASAALLAGIVYIRPLQSFFGTVSLPLAGACAVLAAGGMSMFEQVAAVSSRQNLRTANAVPTF